MRKLAVVALLVIVAVAALAWSQRKSGPYFVSGILEAEEIRVGSRVGGRVRDVLVDEGQQVSTGEALVQLEPFDLHERLREARATLAARQAHLDELNAGYRAEEINQARAKRDRFKAILERLEAGKRPLEIRILEDRLEIARAELVNAESEYARIKALREEQQAAKQEMDDAIRLLDTAKARFAQATDELALAREGTRAEEIAEAKAALDEADHALTLLEKGYRTEEIDRAAAEVTAAQAAVDAIQRQIDELAVTSPCDCIVEAIDLDPGDLIPAGAPVIALLEPRNLWVRAYVPENRLNLAIDQRVYIRVDSIPDRRFPGRITFISRQAEFTPNNVQTPEERSKQVFRIKVVPDEGLDVLRAGMSADVFLEPES